MQFDARFDQLDARMDAMEARLDAHFGQFDARFDQLDARMDAMEARLEASFNKRVLTALGIALTALAIATGILVALFIHYLG